MKKEKIEELFRSNTSELIHTDRAIRVMDVDDFNQAINQAEKENKLEWYKKLEEKLDDLTDYDSVRRILDAINRYQAEIQNKIKELENENN